MCPEFGFSHSAWYYWSPVAGIISFQKTSQDYQKQMVCSLFIGIEVCLDSSVPTCFQYGVLSVVKYSFARNKTLILYVK